MEQLSEVDNLYWEVLFYVIVFGYTAVLLVTSFNYRPTARLFPVTVGALLIGLILLKVGVIALVNWREYSIGGVFDEIGPTFNTDSDADTSEEHLDPVMRYKRQIQMIGWLVLLIVSIWAIGVQAAMIPFTFAFVYSYERDLRKAAIASIVTLLLVYVIFIQILSASLWPGVFI
jgi:hypothetical protein